jgi:hypothetical protein
VLSDTVLDTAVKAKAAIKRLNSPTLELRCDPALTGSAGAFDWRTG